MLFSPVNTKINILLCVLFFITLFIMGRLFYLQINYAHYFTSRSQQNFLRLEEIHPQRGTIYDCHGHALATNRPVHHVYWYGTGNRTLTAGQRILIDQLNTIFTTMPDPLVLESIEKIERLQHKKLLHSDINHTQLCQVAELLKDNPNIKVETHFKRHYPYARYASHIIGYLGNMYVEKEGKMGLEKLFEQSLRGTQGTVINAINSWGKNISKTELLSALTGNNIYTTLDIHIQKISETVFPNQHIGALVVMNPHNGAILSILSRPHFDPSLFLDPITPTAWKALQKDNTFLNRSFTPYPPGSIFKLVTISAALEHAIIDPDAIWYCKGYCTFAKRKYWCARRRGHGKLTTKKALSESCNMPFFEIGKKIDIDLLAEYAYKFGLGTETGILFGEKKGLVPSRLWKEVFKGERWWPGETLSVSIGQSFLLATPIQIARMIGSIFSGHLIQPRFLQEEPVITQPLDIKPETIQFLKRSMKSVIRSGTGKGIKNIKDIEIYAKTSTAQMSGLEKRHEGAAYFEHGWFASYFKYKDYDPLVLVILVEHAGTSQVATTIAKNFLIEYKMLKDTHNHTA